MLQFLVVVLIVAESVHSAKAMGLCRFERISPCNEKTCPVSDNRTGYTKTPIRNDTRVEKISTTNQSTSRQPHSKQLNSKQDILHASTTNYEVQSAEAVSQISVNSTKTGQGSHSRATTEYPISVTAQSPPEMVFTDDTNTQEFHKSEDPNPSTPATSVLDKDCSEIQHNGGTTSGLYTIKPENCTSFEVYCDMDIDGGGWTLFQRRVDDTVDFYLHWDDYKTGFGDLEGNHWLGNENLYCLTKQKSYELRVDLGDFDNATRYAVYDYFRITDELEKYTLTLGNYSGDAGDAMVVCNGQRFSARGDENGNDCPNRFKGGWWYKNCHQANPNGLYLAGLHSSFADGIEWNQWKGFYYSLKFIDLKIRPV